MHRIVRFFSASLTDVEPEGCHIILGVDFPSAGKGSGPNLQRLWTLEAEDSAAIRQPLAQQEQASPVCSSHGGLDVSSADSVSPESFHPRPAT